MRVTPDVRCMRKIIKDSHYRPFTDCTEGEQKVNKKQALPANLGHAQVMGGGDTQTPAFSPESASLMDSCGREHEVTKKQALPVNWCHVGHCGQSQRPAFSGARAGKQEEATPTPRPHPLSRQADLVNTGFDDGY